MTPWGLASSNSGNGRPGSEPGGGWKVVELGESKGSCDGVSELRAGPNIPSSFRGELGGWWLPDLGARLGRT